jgi:hypothetical protein
MQPPSSSGHPPRWVPLPQAVELLGTTDTTLRRWIREGRVQAEAQPRAPGDSRIVYRVLVADPPPSTADPESDHPPLSTTDPPSPTDMIRAAVEPLEKRLVIADSQIAAQAETIRAQAETIGRLQSDAIHLSARTIELQAERDSVRAELEALRVTQSPKASNLATETPDPTPEQPIEPDPFPAPLPPTSNEVPWWRRWLGVVYGW